MAPPHECLHNGDWVLEEVVSAGLLWRHVLCARCEAALFQKALEPDRTAVKPSRVQYTQMKLK